MNRHVIEARHLATAVARFAGTLAGRTARIGRFLLLSPGHDALWPQRVLSVIIEQGGLSVISGDRILSRIAIRGVRRYPCPGRYPQPDQVMETVRLAAGELRTPAKEITLMVPKEWVIARRVELPSATNENLQAAVSSEMDRFTPLSPENALYDFLPLWRDEATLSLFLAVCRADVINPYISALEAGSIKVARVATGLTAAATASSFIASAATLAFAEVVKDGYSGGIVVDGRVAGLFAGTFGDAPPEARVEKIKEELSRVTAPGLNGDPRAEAVMVGDESIPRETLRQSIASAFILNDLDRERLHREKNLSAFTLSEMGSIIEPLWSKTRGIDLLARGERKKEMAPLALTVILLVALAAITLVYAIAPLNMERRRLEGIERQIALLKEPVRKAEALKKEMENQERENGTIENFKSGQPRVVDILREVTRVLPKNAWLTRARITDKGVDLEGYAGSAAAILPRLESSPLLAKVEFASPTYRDARQNADRFVIRMEIENEKRPGSGGPKDEVTQ